MSPDKQSGADAGCFQIKMEEDFIQLLSKKRKLDEKPRQHVIIYLWCYGLSNSVHVEYNVLCI